MSSLTFAAPAKGWKRVNRPEEQRIFREVQKATCKHHIKTMMCVTTVDIYENYAIKTCSKINIFL